MIKPSDKAKIFQADQANIVRKVKAGKPLSKYEREIIETQTTAEPEGLPEFIAGAKLALLSGLSDRRHRQIAKDGYFPDPIRGRYKFEATISGLFKFYREKQKELREVKQAIADEQHRRLKRENDLEDDLVVSRAEVVSEFRKVVEPIKQMMRQKLENEYPLAVAGLDVPQARIYGKRLEDDILTEWQKLFDRFAV